MRKAVKLGSKRSNSKQLTEKYKELEKLSKREKSFKKRGRDTKAISKRKEKLVEEISKLRRDL